MGPKFGVLIAIQNQDKTSPKGLVLSWLELGHGNITFSEEIDFDPEELDIVYADNDTEASQ